MQKFAFAFGLFILLATGAQAQTKGCSVLGFPTADHQTAEGKMMVKAGHWCAVRLGVPLGGIADVTVSKEPQHGTVVIRGYRILYTPKKGYAGADEFTYVRNSIDIYGEKAPRTVNMKVQVFQ
jgi:hypothetical protein